MKRLAAVLVLALAALVGSPGLASAHSDLVSTIPEDGAVLAEAPTELVFTFSEPLMPDFVRFIALSPDGTSEDLIVTGVEGPVATVSWPGGAGPGTWDVQYRVVSQDGHPVNGGILFTYDADPAPVPSPTPEPTSSEPTAAPTPEPIAESSVEASPSASATDTATTPAASTSSNGGWIIAGIAVAVLALIAVVGVVLRSRSS